MAENLYMDLHVLQTVPPSCVNRDDTGSPKTAVYGGVLRARVSSQSWKRAMRLMFREELPEQCGIRTKHLPEELTKRMMALDSSVQEDKAMKLAMKTLTLSGIGVKEKEQKNDALFFISAKQLDALARLAVEGKADKDRCHAALTENPAIDIALFGRMVANDPSLNYDAAAQVAHSISTHAVHNEYDYFTAVDDCSPEDNAGAGHIGTVEFNSSTLYRYATVNIRELAGNLGDGTTAAARCFAEAFIRSMPTGKQSTFANRTLPDFIYLAFRKDQSVNLCGAFERPVSTRGDGYMMPSVAALIKYAEMVYSQFAPKPDAAWTVGDFPGMETLGERKPLFELLPEAEQYVRAALDGGVM